MSRGKSKYTSILSIRVEPKMKEDIVTRGDNLGHKDTSEYARKLFDKELKKEDE